MQKVPLHCTMFNKMHTNTEMHASISGIITTKMSVGFNTNIPYIKLMLFRGFISNIFINWTHIETFCSNSRSIYKRLILKQSYITHDIRLILISDCLSLLLGWKMKIHANSSKPSCFNYRKRNEYRHLVYVLKIFAW